MNKYDAIQVLKEELAKFAVRYPLLVGRIGSYISKHPDPELALVEAVRKLIELDRMIAYEFRLQLLEINE
jgi:hypothetical protein